MKRYILLFFVLFIPMVSAYKDAGIYVEFYSDTKMGEIAKDKIVIDDKLIFPKEIVVASKSLKEFYEHEKKIKDKIHKDIIVRYWIVLEKEEGYWISFKAKIDALERVFNEIKNRKNKDKLYIMIDFENPIQDVKDYDLDKNKELIDDILVNKEIYNLDISFVENAPILKNDIENKMSVKIYNVEEVKMFYSSLWEKHKILFRNFISKILLKREIKRGLKDDKDYVIAFGVLDKGIQGDEPLISENRLKYDLGLAKKYNIKKVMLFSYNSKYKEVIKDFIFS